MKIQITLLTVCMTLILGLTLNGNAKAGLILLDDFNRPNSTNMGPNWNEVSGDFQIVNNRARGSGTGSMIFNDQTSTTVVVDVFKINGGSDDYGAILLGFQNTANNLYIKVQSQNGAANFESVGFYFGENGSNNSAWSESFYSSDILTPFSSARLVVSLVGSNVSLGIDTDFNGTPEQTITRGSVPLGLLGTGIGLGGWTGVGSEIDNFSIPEPATICLLGLGSLALIRRR
jgi:hypothetical protein